MSPVSTQPDATETPSLGGPPLLSLEGVKKRFGEVRALDGVNFDLRRGEIHALLGENGAGKSTLIKTLAGVHSPDEDIIRIDGEIASIKDVSDADHYGIRVIHQELSLAPNLSIAENIFLGRELASGVASKPSGAIFFSSIYVNHGRKYIFLSLPQPSRPSTLQGQSLPFVN